MSVSPKTDIHANILARVGTVPANSSGAQTGTGIDRMGYSSCLLVVETGAASGTPSPQTCDCKLQESSDDGSPDAYADISGAAITQITADNGRAHVSVNLAGCERYIRAITTVSLTGGSSPKWPVAAEIILGGADNLPAA